jgi:hypothetical protein
LVYLESEKGWKEDVSSFCKPIIATLHQGEINIHGMHLTAIRGPQDSVFVLISCMEYFGKNKKCTQHFAGGIGGDGWQDEIQMVLKDNGLTEEDPADWVGGSESTGTKGWRRFIQKASGKRGPGRKIYHKRNARFVGILPSTVRAFIKWLDSEISEHDTEGKAWLKKVKASKTLRFNQGDAFFAKHFNVDIPATEAGKAQKTVLLKIMDRMFKGE